ncbi:MAG: VWA domain-containing protein [Deltaproteobacteria bacterium]|nr:VWA domain-containing protein [Deltaproteobacteria bacterium]
MSFLAPLGLVLGVLAAPLVALYFLKLRRRRVRVPSVLLWQAFERSERLATPFERFRRNLLLLLQLLALALIVLALARPYLETEVAVTRSVILVLDTSASMGAADVRPHRLGSAVDSARELVSNLGPGDEAMLIIAGPHTEVRVPFTRDVSRLGSELGRVEVTGAEGSLREGLQLALSMARSRPGVEVVVFSDGGGGGLGDLPTGGATVRYVPVGRDSANAAILALDLRRSPASELDRQLFVTAQNFGRAEVAGTVEVYVGDQLVGLRNESLVPEHPVHMVFALPASAEGVLRVHLDTPGDLLDGDDTAWLVVSPLALRRVLLVGGDALTARAVAADPRVRLTRVSAAGLTPDLLDQSDAVLFARGTVPADLQGRNYAVLGPLEGSPVTFGEEVRTPAVLGWQRTHPVVRFVGWGDVIMARSRAVTDTGGLEPIVDSDGGPLLLAGQVGGGRVVQLAFDPLESDLPLRVAWPVTLLNAVGWMTEGASSAEGSRSIATGAPYVRRLATDVDPEAVLVYGPAGDPVDAQVADGLLRVRDTTRVGLYEVRGGGVKASFTANLLSARESDIEPRAALNLADHQVEMSQASVVGRRELWRLLALLAIAVLLGEWFAWNRRRSA